MREIIVSNEAYRSTNPFSQAVKVGDFLFLSGQGPLDAKTKEIMGRDIVEQTKKVFENISFILKAANLTLDDIVRITAYISDQNDFEEFNKVYAKIMDEPYPARTTIISKLLGDFKIEIDVIAFKGKRPQHER